MTMKLRMLPSRFGRASVPEATESHFLHKRRIHQSVAPRCTNPQPAKPKQTSDDVMHPKVHFVSPLVALDRGLNNEEDQTKLADKAIT